MAQGILIIIAFVIIAALMITKKMPTLLALPLLAVIICIIAGVPAVGKDADGNAIGWLQTVLEAGTVRMGAAIMAVIFGAWLAQLMNKTGVTENIIKRSAELGGDKPFVVNRVHSSADSDFDRRSGNERGCDLYDGLHDRTYDQHRSVAELCKHLQPRYFRDPVLRDDDDDSDRNCDPRSDHR